ncbi:MAG: tetratricopeptide repeat protein [Pseudomonadota bacterium]
MSQNEVKPNVKDESLGQYMRELARGAFSERSQRPSFDKVVDRILIGRNSDDGAVEHLPRDWRVALSRLIEHARQQGDGNLIRDLQVIEKTLSAGVALGDEREPQLPRGTPLEIVDSCSTQELSSWVAGTLGLAAATAGDLSLAIELTRHAVVRAQNCSLLREECDWTANLGALLQKDDPAAGEELFCKALDIANAVPCERRKGRLCNNLAVLYARLQRLAEAIELQREALRIARKVEDEIVQGRRAAFMGQLLEANGERERSIQHFCEAVRSYCHSGDLKTCKQLMTYLIAIVINPLESETSSVLGERLKKTELTHEAMLAIMEQVKEEGKTITYSSESKIAFKPDTAFAHSLCDRQEWKALAVYAKHWAEQTEIAGDGQGYHWLAVALVKLGYESFAGVCLEWALRLPLAFE